MFLFLVLPNSDINYLKLILNIYTNSKQNKHILIMHSAWVIITTWKEIKNTEELMFLLLDLNVRSCPLSWRLNEAEQFVSRQPSLNQCTMGTGKPRTTQCTETSAPIATVMLSGPWMICSLLGTPTRCQHFKILTPLPENVCE